MAKNQLLCELKNSNFWDSYLGYCENLQEKIKEYCDLVTSEKYIRFFGKIRFFDEKSFEKRRNFQKKGQIRIQVRIEKYFYESICITRTLVGVLEPKNGV